MTKQEKRIARRAAGIIAKAALRGTLISAVTQPDGSAGLLLYWGAGEMPRDILAELTGQPLKLEVARRVLDRQTKQAETDPAA